MAGYGTGQARGARLRLDES